MEDVSVTFEGGARLGLVLKSPGREAPGSNARRVKPGRVTFPWREAWVYGEVLSVMSGPPAWYGVVEDRGGGPSLLLERVDGLALTGSENARAWNAAAAWLGRFHARRWTRTRESPLLVHDRALHRWWFQRAVERMGGGGAAVARRPTGGEEGMRVLRSLEAAHTRACESLFAEEPTLVHGEFRPSNVLVEAHRGELHIRPVDWEMTGLGPPLLDLAALAAGRWDPTDRTALAVAYRNATLAAGSGCASVDRVLRLLAASGLLLAIQGLGWGEGSSPPHAGHEQDWLLEAVRCAEQIEA